MRYLERENSPGMDAFVLFWISGKLSIPLVEKRTYADDTTCTVFLRETESISHLLKLPSQFKVVSGLEVNTFKTEAMWLGKWKNRSDTPFNFNWPVGPICAFVVFFSYGITKADNLNFDKKLRNMETILNI